ANPNLFRHLDPEMRANRDVALAAAKADINALSYASANIKADKEAAKEYLASCRELNGSLSLWDESVRDDREIVDLAITKIGGGAILGASQRLLEDRALVKTALEKGVLGKPFALFPSPVKADRELCLLAVKYSHWAFRYIDTSLQYDVTFCLDAVHANPAC